MKKLIAVILTLGMLLGLCACGSSKEEEALCGTYTLYAMNYDEDTILYAEELMGGENTITLKSGGMADMVLQDQPATVKWKIDGTKLTLTAADGDMEGSIENGILTLVLDGSNLYYLAEGVSGESIPAMTLDEMLNGVMDEALGDASDWLSDEGEASESGAPKALTEVQEMWNGWWYGGIDINGCSGDWEVINNMTYDATMYVELDENGVGFMEVYEFGQIMDSETPNLFAELNCHGDLNYLYGDSGTSFGLEINSSDWMFVHNLANAEKINMGSAAQFDNGKLGYDLTLMPWGSYWEGEEAYTCFLPGFEDYIECIEDGQIDPYGNYAESESGSERESEPSEPTEPSDSGKSSEKASTGSSGAKSPLLGSNPTKLDIGNGRLFVYYPGDLFDYNADYGKIQSKDSGLGILFDPMLGENNLEELRASYEEVNSKEDDYSLRDLTVNGYKAICMTYSDWLGSTMRVDVDFGAEYDEYFGISFAVSGDSLEECDTELVWAIIESFELK